MASDQHNSYGYLYELLEEFASVNSRLLGDLNLETMDAVRKNLKLGAIEAARASALASFPDLEAFAHSLQPLAARYDELFVRNVSAQLTPSLVDYINHLHLSTGVLLAQMPQTSFVIDLADCFEHARYDLLPSVVTDAMAAESVVASDMALVRLSGLVPLMGDRIVYPRGMKTSLKTLSKATAESLSRESGISYSTGEGLFCHGDSRTDSKGLNVISAGGVILGSCEGDELFTVGELIDFVSILASTPFAAGMQDTGRRIYAWIESLFLAGDRTVGFERDEYYHCRKRLAGDMPYTWDEMRRAPHGLPWAGRFNPPGSAHFYFASSRDGAENEVKKYLGKGEVLQTVRIVPRKSISLLDLSHTMQRGKTFLRMVRYALSKGSESNNMPREYLLPCFVADCCKMIGFDGIMYYGSKEYTNFVSWDDGYFAFGGMC